LLLRLLIAFYSSVKWCAAKIHVNQARACAHDEQAWIASRSQYLSICRGVDRRRTSSGEHTGAHGAALDRAIENEHHHRYKEAGTCRREPCQHDHRNQFLFPLLGCDFSLGLLSYGALQINWIISEKERNAADRNRIWPKRDWIDRVLDALDASQDPPWYGTRSMWW